MKILPKHFQVAGFNPVETYAQVKIKHISETTTYLLMVQKSQGQPPFVCCVFETRRKYSQIMGCQLPTSLNWFSHRDYCTWQKNIIPKKELGRISSPTPWKINMEPEKTPLEEENHLPNHIISRFELLIFRGVYILNNPGPLFSWNYLDVPGS